MTDDEDEGSDGLPALDPEAENGSWVSSSSSLSDFLARFRAV